MQFSSSSRGMSGGIPMVSLPDLPAAATAGGLQPQFNNHHFAAAATNDDHFFDQMLSPLPPPCWPDLAPPEAANNNHHQITPYVVDESSLLASRLRQHHITPPAALQLNQQQMPILGVGGGGESAEALLLLPMSLGNRHLVDRPLDHEGTENLYNGFGGSLQRGSAGSEQHFSSPGSQGGTAASAAPARQRVRARRGQATDPHSIAERQRRERIADRMKSLQELVPNANKTDKASNLDDIIDYVKFLQLQVKVLSMSRLGGAAAVAPLVAHISSDVARGGGGNAVTEAGSNDILAVTENRVAKLMEEDMGSALQYLQGKGLCLMPISLASAIGNEGQSSSSNMSVLTVQSAMANAGGTTSSMSKI